MAVSGGAKSAYKIKLIGDRMDIQSATAMDTLPPLPAAAAILRGEAVVVGGFDSAVVQRLVSLQLGIKAQLAALVEATNRACQAAAVDRKPEYVVNWSSFRCVGAEFYMNEFGSFGYRVYVEEAEPTSNIALATFITKHIAGAGFEGVTVICEW